ncbi:unnamed protein product [Phytomonas sp. EM1]|nr:unnamed protein product [Phytomonas sp. EM1]|eukprot:CCW64487.1 unnamed protein product [Phytomonas sp. isolate EM1]
MYSPFELIDGELVDLHICSPINSPEGVAIVYFKGSKGKECVLRPCTLLLSQYRIMLWVDGDPQCTVNISLLAIDRWKIQPANHHVSRALDIIQQQEPRSVSSSPQNSSSSVPLLLTLNLKHVWAHHVLLPRNSMIIRNIQARLTACANTSRLDQLPAFTLEQSRKQQWQRAATALELDEDSRLGEDFGWCLWNSRLEWDRLLCANPTQAVPDTQPAEGVKGAVAVGKDLRPWFHHISMRTNTSDDGSTDGEEEGHTATLYISPATYPMDVVEPITVDKTLLLGAMTARSRARFPALSYVHLASGAVLARSSQPLLRSQRLYLDVILCQALVNRGFSEANLASARTTSATPERSSLGASPSSPPAFVPPPSLFEEHRIGGLQLQPSCVPNSGASPLPSGVLKVADCRPLLTAKGNAQLGGGYESGAQYSFCSTEFYHIENIVCVSKSFDKLRALVSCYQGDNAEEGFYKTLHDTQWLYHIQRILVCSSEVSQSIVKGQSCLVHCTDGWDRTAQCCATAMLLLDPFYRTAGGFCMLIEKEFCSFGHKFAERSAHQVPGRTSLVTHSGVSASDTETRDSSGKLDASPIFVQFMDVIFQIMRQFPDAFEFTTQLLEYLSEEIYSGFYGTFLCNCVQERTLEGVRLRTRSIWTDVMRRVQSERRGELPLRFVNAQYDYETAWAGITRRNTESSILTPSCNSKSLVFWDDLYFKADLDRCVKRERDIKKRREVTRVLSWGLEFDAFLDEFIQAACRGRAEEVPQLQRMEKILQASSTSTQPSTRSSWCTFDPDICFGCFKSIGVFTAAARCDTCKHSFCMDCVVHVCVG